eukprot:1140439-Pelagomonas_calceolata.AAC.2
MKHSDSISGMLNKERASHWLSPLELRWTAQFAKDMSFANCASVLVEAYPRSKAHYAQLDWIDGTVLYNGFTQASSAFLSWKADSADSACC